MMVVSFIVKFPPERVLLSELERPARMVISSTCSDIVMTVSLKNRVRRPWFMSKSNPSRNGSMVSGIN